MGDLIKIVGVQYAVNSTHVKGEDMTEQEQQKTIDDAIAHIKNKQPEHQIIFLKAWNEWGEGNYVEPDKQFGHGWLNAIKNALNK